jgi:hypothetical protein
MPLRVLFACSRSNQRGTGMVAVDTMIKIAGIPWFILCEKGMWYVIPFFIKDGTDIKVCQALRHGHGKVLAVG